MPDGGSARADFPGGDAGQLYDSIQKVLALPDEMRLFICHDYGPGGRAVASETTVGQQRRENIHTAEGISREQFIEMRTTRDATLKMPKLILPSIQVNMRAGDLPEQDGKPTIKIPINAL
jgi:glyoxylase-like metal-dependent hydrolase (beta-lactamase superfamily II)